MERDIKRYKKKRDKEREREREREREIKERERERERVLSIKAIVLSRYWHYQSRATPPPSPSIWAP